jgi:DNA-binding SARP family transcriptional activator
VTVASLDNEGRWVAEVRQAAPGDRRRRTQLNWISEPRLHVYALGRTRIESREGDLGGPWLNQRAGQLFKYLVSERQREVAADEIAEAIWPKSDPRILTTVRYFIHRLRRELEPEPPDNGPSSFISSNQGGYRLERGAVWVDADEFEQKVKVGLAALSNGNEHLLEEAIDLYQGDFLADEPYAVWSVRERDRLRLLAERSLLGLIEHRLRQGDKKGALRHMRSLAELEPYDIAIHRDLIETCLACGRRGEAIRRYSELRTRFREEFGEDLNLQLSDLPLGDRLAGGWR